MDKKNISKRNPVWVVALIGLTSLGLSACTPTPQFNTTLADGPPPFPVDVSKIPDAVPKNEPKAAYGNPRSYVAKGRRYYVLNSARGYNKQGLASWYGTKFQGRLTSTHEHYNLLAMTAASPELPLPCYVRVTNLENGRQVIVKVNDRGPFASSRVMDLSYAAAKKLGYSGKGTAHVQVTAVEPGDSRSYSYHPYFASNSTHFTTTHRVNTASQSHHLYLQVGAFARAQNANQLKSQIAMFTARPVRVNTVYRNSHPLYQVQIGPFLNPRESFFLSHKLRQKGWNSTHAVMLG